MFLNSISIRYVASLFSADGNPSAPALFVANQITAGGLQATAVRLSLFPCWFSPSICTRTSLICCRRCSNNSVLSSANYHAALSAIYSGSSSDGAPAELYAILRCPMLPSASSTQRSASGSSEPSSSWALSSFFFARAHCSSLFLFFITDSGTTAFASSLANFLLSRISLGSTDHREKS